MLPLILSFSVLHVGSGVCFNPAGKVFHFPADYSGAVNAAAGSRPGLPVSGIKGSAVQLGAGETHVLALTTVRDPLFNNVHVYVRVCLCVNM